jgi:hypothetical protein
MDHTNMDTYAKNYQPNQKSFFFFIIFKQIKKLHILQTNLITFYLYSDLIN